MSREQALVDGIHLRELAHVHDEHAAPQDALQARPRRFQNRCHVLQHLLGLRLDIEPGQLAGGRIRRALTRHEHETLERDTGHVRPDRLRQSIAEHWTMHQSPPLPQWRGRQTRRSGTPSAPRRSVRSVVVLNLPCPLYLSVFVP
jgi:hypothetical protein